MKVAAFIGKKGGVGKSLLAHGACCMARHWNVPHAYYVLTDDRVLLPSENRTYKIEDGRTTAGLEKLISKAKTVAAARADDPDFRAIMVIDGGGNRKGFDEFLHEISDLTILPFLPDGESMRTVALDLDRLEKAVALPNMWSKNPFKLKADNEYAEHLRAKFGSRVLSPIPTTSSLRELLLAGFDWRQMSDDARRTSRAVAGVVVDQLYRK